MCTSVYRHFCGGCAGNDVPVIKASLIIRDRRIEALLPDRDQAMRWLNQRIVSAEEKGHKIKSPFIKEVITDEEQFGFLQGDACAAEWQAYYS